MPPRSRSSVGSPQGGSAGLAFTTVERVKSSLGIGIYDVVDDDWLQLVVDATNMSVCQWRPDLWWNHCTGCQAGTYAGQRGCCCTCHFGGGTGRGGDFARQDYAFQDYSVPGTTSGAWYYLGDPRVTLGATMLATRWYKRRGSEEISAFTEFGGPPPTVDKDVETLLQINRAFRPVVA